MASSSSGPEEAYLNDARYAIVLLLQRMSLAKQVSRLETLITECVDAQDANNKLDVRDRLPSRSFDEVIQKRFQSASDVLPVNRVLDDLEISLLGILDSDSRIALKSKLGEFMVLMTRAVTMDHRALCMYVLEHCLTESCQKQFISDGGYRILKTWMRNAFEEDVSGDYAEVVAIIHILKVLPVNQESAKTTGIGQLIKELKNKKIAVNEIEALKVAWKEYLAKQKKGSGASSSSSTPSQPIVEPVDPGVLEAVRLKIFGKRGLPKEFEEEQNEEDAGEDEGGKSMDVDVEEPVSEGGTDVECNGDSTMAVENEDEARSDSKKNKVPPAEVALPPAKRPRPGLKIISVNALADSGAPSPVAASSSSSSSSNGAAAAAAVRESAGTAAAVGADISSEASDQARGGEKERVVIDMAEIARKRRANEDATASSSSSNSSSSSSSSGDGGDNGDFVSSSQMAQPGVGGMKKRPGRRLQVVWADQVSGADSGALRQVQTFEVDKKGGRDVEKWKNKKSHKEREKRERMAEKDKVTSQRRETMHRTVEWIPPEKLKLSIEIRDREQVQSKEREIQDSRIEDLIEVRYLDESLIPPDPDDAHDALHPMPGAPPTQVINVLETPGAASFEDTLHNTAQRDDALLLAGGAGGGGHGGIVMSGTHPSAAPTPQIVYGSIPSQLHNLEPALLQVISKDETRMMSLLNADGSVNMAQVQQLRNSLQGAQGPPPTLNVPIPLMGAGLPPQGSGSSSGGTGRVGSRFSRAAPPTVTAGLPLPQPQVTAPPVVGPSTSSTTSQRVAPGVDAGRLNARKRTPCKWFLSPKGCQNGDACTFGHFAMPGQRR